MILQLIILINRKRDMVYRSTEKKILTSNATIKFKLSNLVKVIKHKNLNKVCLAMELVRFITILKIDFSFSNIERENI